MNKTFATWLLGGASLIFAATGVAQSTEQAAGVAQQDAAVLDEQASNSTGLLIEEIRTKDRLDRVVIQHGEGGLSEYYDLRGSSEEYQDGGFTERGLMRRWKLGRKR